MSISGRGSDMSQSSLPPGTQLNGTYEIGALINAGGMGEVYKAHNIATGDPVAIKVVLPEYAADQLILDLFRKEARILNQLTHEAIVRYYGFASDRTLNRSYMAMEFVEGPSLAHQMRVGPLSSTDVAGLKTRLADGLQRAHELGIIHRDISPENVILQGGLVSRGKIIDFGIAKSSALAAEGTLIGTTFAGRYNFASPEQVGMYRPAGVSPLSDIYSLGLVLAAALRGSPIDMSGTMAEIMEKRMAVPDLSGIPEEMRDLLTAMLEPKPGDRITSMAEVRDWHIDVPATPAGNSKPGPAPAGDVPPRGISSKRPVQVRLASKPPPKLTPKLQPRIDEEHGGSRIGLWIGIGALAVVLAGAGGGWYYVKSKTGAWQEANIQDLVPETPTPPAAPPAASVPQLEEPGKTTTEKPPEVSEPPPPSNTTAVTEPPAVKPATPEEPAVKTANLAAAGSVNTPSKMRDFIAGYDGGNCYFAWPRELRTDAARISGLGVKAAPFEKFLADFQTASGIAADINLHSINPAQCPAVEALKQLARGKSAVPSLSLLQQSFPIGGSLIGQMADIPGRHLDLLYVSNSGETYKLTNLVKDNSFTFRIGQGKPTNEQFPLPQLLIVLSSPQPLQTLANISETSPKPAARLFPELVKEAEINGEVTIAVQYFRLDQPGG